MIGKTEKGRVPCSATGSRAALGSSNSSSPTPESGPRVCMKVRALYLHSYSSLEEVCFSDLHGNPLLLPTAESLGWLRSRQFAERATNGTIFIVVLDANHVMDRVRAGEICPPTIRQTFDHGVCAPETRCLINKLMVSGMFGVTECDVVFNLVKPFQKDYVAIEVVRHTETGNNV
jgi:hypothetical protein